MRITRFLNQPLFLWIGFLIVTACVSCQTKPNSSILPNDFTNAFLPINNETIAQLGELSVVEPLEHASKVNLVAYNVPNNKVLGVYLESGRLISWEGDNFSKISGYDLGIASENGLAFNRSASLLMGATKRFNGIGATGQEKTLIAGINIWSTDAGKLIRCVLPPCSNFSQSDYGVGDINAIIDPSGNWVYTYDEYVYGSERINRAASEGPGINIINSPDSYLWTIGKIVPLPGNSGKIVVIFEEGRVVLYGGIFPKTLEEGKEHDLQPIGLAKIDDTGTWLAFYRDNKLSVLSIGGNYKIPQLDEQIEDLVGLDFNTEGTLLFIAHDDKISIWNLENRIEVMELEAFEISSLWISEDNRLLVWGDNLGQVHVWGIPESERNSP